MTNWLDACIGWALPSAGRKRLQDRLWMRYYDAALSGPRRQGFGGRATSANVETGGAIGPLRDRARSMVRNTPHGHAMVDVMVRHVVGTGLVPVWNTGSDRIDAQVTALWDQWAARADVEGELDFYSQQALAVRGMIEGGEALGRYVDLRYVDDPRLPMRLQLLEGDHIDAFRDNYLQFAVGGDGSYRRLGIELDKWARRLGFWLFPVHPGEAYSTRLSELVPAEQIRHLYRPERIGQIRGVTWLAPVLLSAKDLSDLLQNTIVKTGIEASFAAFITGNSTGSGPLAGSATRNPDTGEIEYMPEPGTMYTLQPGQDIKFAEPKTSTQFEPIAVNTLQAMAVGAGLTYDQMTGDLRRANYSSLRAGKIEFRRLIEQVQHQTVIPRFLDRIADRFVDRAILAGSLRPRADGYPRSWVPPANEPIDPQKDLDADIRAVRAGRLSPQEFITMWGRDWRKVMKDSAAFWKFADDNKIVLDIDPRRPMAGAPLAPAPPGEGTPSGGDTSDPAGTGGDDPNN